MNSITLIALLCCSVASAAHLGPFNGDLFSIFKKDAPGPIGNLIIKSVTLLVINSEQFIPGWNESLSLLDNVENVVDAPLRTEGLPAWNPDASVEENLISGISFLFTIAPLPEFDRSKTIAENVQILVDHALALAPFPTLPIGITRKDAEKKVAELIDNILSYIPGFNINNTLQANIESYVKEILKIAKGIDASKSLIVNINIMIETTLDQIKTPGFSPDKTLDQNVVDILTEYFTKLPL